MWISVLWMFKIVMLWMSIYLKLRKIYSSTICSIVKINSRISIVQELFLDGCKVIRQQIYQENHHDSKNTKHWWIDHTHESSCIIFLQFRSRYVYFNSFERTRHHWWWSIILLTFLMGRWSMISMSHYRWIIVMRFSRNLTRKIIKLKLQHVV